MFLKTIDTEQIVRYILIKNKSFLKRRRFMYDVEMDNQYIESIDLIENRLIKLKEELKEMEIHFEESVDIDTYEEIEKYKRRISVLYEIYLDLKKVRLEAKNYYNKEWYRSEKYTVNSRKSRYNFAPVRSMVEEYVIYKLEGKEDDEK